MPHKSTSTSCSCNQVGQSRTQITTSAVNNRTVASYPLEKGNLLTATARVTDVSILPALVYAAISIAIDGNQPENIIATLAQGHLGSGLAVAWTGNIPLSSGMTIMIETWGRTATIVTLNCITA